MYKKKIERVCPETNNKNGKFGKIHKRLGEDSKISKGTPLPSYLNVVKAKDKFSPYFPFSPIGQNCHFQRAPLPCPWFIQLLTKKFQGLFKDFSRTK